MATYSLPTGHQYLEARLVWDYTQDYNNNTSTIKAHVEARRTSSYMSTMDLSNPNMEIIIDGEYFNSNGNYNFGAHAVWEWFWIGGEATKTVWHNNDGTRSLNISTWHNTSITNFGNIWKTQSVTLAVIPRASTISSGTDWVVGHNTGININRRSADYYHSVLIDIGDGTTWQNFAVRYGVGSYVGTNFSQIEQRAMMDYLISKGNPWQVQSRIRLETYSASGYQVGSTTSITGTIWRPAESSVASQTPIELALTGVPYSLSGVNSSVWITHSVRLYSSSFSKTVTLSNGASPNGNIALMQGEIDSIYALYTSQSYAPFNIEVTTLLAGKQLGSKKTLTAGGGRLDFNSASVAPTFSGTPTYTDTNTAITAVTTNNQHIVQNKSNLKITIPASSATSKYGATLVTYAVSVNGVEKTAAYSSSTVVVDFGTVNVGTNTTAQVSVIDSRGVRTTKTITITVFPYSNPTVIGSAARANGFDSNTTLSASGTLSSVNAKNGLTFTRYRYKLTTTGTWGSWISLTPTVTNGTFTTNAPVVSLDNSLTYNLEFNVTDKFDGTSTASVYLDMGKPIMFVDKAHKSVGIGKFPIYNNSLETAGDVYVGGSEYVTGNLSVTGTGGNVYTTSKKPTPAEIGAASSSHTHTLASLGAEAAIVYGSNTNGNYMKFADGTLICYGSSLKTASWTDTAYGGIWKDAYAFAVTFPMSFIANPTTVLGTGESAILELASKSKTGASFTIVKGTRIEGFDLYIHWEAIGRWKA